MIKGSSVVTENGIAVSPSFIKKSLKGEQFGNSQVQAILICQSSWDADINQNVFYSSIMRV